MGRGEGRGAGLVYDFRRQSVLRRGLLRAWKQFVKGVRECFLGGSEAPKLNPRTSSDVRGFNLRGLTPFTKHALTPLTKQC